MQRGHGSGELQNLVPKGQVRRQGQGAQAARKGHRRPDGTCRALQVDVTGGLTEPAELHRWTSQTALYYVWPEAPSPWPGWYPLDQLCLVHAVEPQRGIRGGSLVPC